ncbi:MAG TPA: hypothetical protein VL990_09045 [Acidobacteriaceae bacterium]|nr:hypothetical protein [Acidobacteriaceae bacterium]
MTDPAAPHAHPNHPGGDVDFGAVVIAAGIVTLVFFIGAFLIVGLDGRSLLPKVQHDYEPYSCLTLPVSSALPG